jgi:hypothetical protein
MVATLVGALVLARAVNDAKLSDDILRATKSRLKDRPSRDPWSWQRKRQSTRRPS